MYEIVYWVCNAFDFVICGLKYYYFHLNRQWCMFYYSAFMYEYNPLEVG